LNLDLDHHVISETAEMLRILTDNTPGTIILNGDDKNLRESGISGTATFSIDNPSLYRAIDIVYSHFETAFRIESYLFNAPLSNRFILSLPGPHNLSNALACIAFLLETGIPVSEIAAVLPEFIGVERRFDIHLNVDGWLVIDDYAHNPHKIASLMKTMAGIRDRICYIFQPHGFGPTRLMRNEYIRAFKINLRDSDHLIFLPIFYAGGTAHKDISSEDLAEEIHSGGKSAEAVQDRDIILRRLSEWKTYVVFGARDDSLSDFAKKIALSLRSGSSV
jgi:UDP-N-acetylmuramate--alanine ligase